MVDNEDSASTIGDGGFHRDGISGVGRRSSVSLESVDGGSLVAEDDIPSSKCNRCCPVCSYEENMEDGCSHPVSFQACTADNKDNGVMSTSGITPMQEENLGVHDDYRCTLSSANIANLPSSLLKLCMGAEVSTGSLPEASQSRPQGVWVNASSNPIQPASVLPQAGSMFKGD